MKRIIVRTFALCAVALPAISLFSMLPGAAPARATDPPPPIGGIEGTRQSCVDFKLDVLSGFITGLAELVTLGLADVDAETFQADLPDEGWVWVDPDDHYEQVEGVVEGSKVAAIDWPATHDSHDYDAEIRVDPEYSGLLARANGPNKDDIPLVDPKEIGLEWEIGTFTGETGRNEPERFFPRWAWPATGDRVWADGHWVIDCGHGREIDGEDHFRSEIHPARAIASMREQVHTLPGTGTTEVPVTATDLYIHGRSGYIVEILTHGQGILTDGSGFDADHDVNDHLTTPIAENFDFDVCLPAQPSPGAVPAYYWEYGPGDNIPIDPDLEFRDSTDGICPGPKELHVRVPLEGSGVSPGQVYARKIYAGWVEPADSLRHFIVKLDRMDLHDDAEVEFSAGGDCECTFFYVNLDKAADEWYRLADWWEETCNIFVFNPFGDDFCIDHNQLYDYDSDEFLGNGYLDFSGPTFDFLVANGQPFNIRSNGYDQDCLEGYFGLPLAPHHWNAVEYAVCYYLSAVVTFEFPFLTDHVWGQADAFARANACFVESDTNLCETDSQKITGYGVGTPDVEADGEYELEFTVSEQEVTEDPADLAVSKSCAHGGEVALVGQPFTCTITVTNAGPGLPHDVVVSDTITTVPAGVGYTLATPTYTISYGGQSGAPQNCTVTPPGQISCAIASVPVGGSATVSVRVTPSAAGTFNDTASASAATTDPSSANNSANASVRVFLPVAIDIRPGIAINSINLGANGVIDVAIVRTSTFNSSTVAFATVCFGDAGDPAQRDCSETHGKAHFIDIDKDKDQDMVLHYEVEHSGIDPGDTTACLIGQTTAGIGIYGCDTIRTQ